MPARAAAQPIAAEELDCRTCGACCANSRPNRQENYIDYVQVLDRDRLRKWPQVLHRFTVVNRAGETHLRLVGRQQRCAALEGVIGSEVSCGIYELRPRACRIVKAGSNECLARRSERRIR